MKFILLALALLLGAVLPANAQSVVHVGCAVPAATYPASSTGQPVAIDENGNACVTSRAIYPTGAVPLSSSTTGTTAATAATLAGAAGKTTYLCGLSIRSNATAAATGNATVTGVATTLNYTHWTAPLASGIGITEEIYDPCIPASAANTAIVVTSPAPGAGGTVSVTATGYQL